MRILLAFDKFKDAMSASRACEIAKEVLRKTHPEADIVAAPITDGGEGFAEILTTAADGELIHTEVQGPRFELIPCVYGLVAVAKLDPNLLAWLDLPAGADRIGIIEMAQASGLERLGKAERDLWRTSTFGTGILLGEACRRGATAVVMGIGGSATNDLGTGVLQAMGLHFHTKDGPELADLVPLDWERVDHLRGSVPLPAMRIACDVTNPLLGDRGAAAVYGPQKGLQSADLSKMQTSMERMGRMLCEHFGKNFDELSREAGAGAAGGIGFGLRAAASDAAFRPGFELVARWLKLEENVAGADLVITGEGRFDESSLTGKGPGALIQLAQKHGKEVRVFAGAVKEEALQKLPEGLDRNAVNAITPDGYELSRALAEAPDLLARAIRATEH